MPPDSLEHTIRWPEVFYVCRAPVESLFVDEHGLLALTARGVERVPVPEEC